MRTFDLLRGIKRKFTVSIVAAVLLTAVVLSLITSVLIAYTFRLSLKSRAVETAKILNEALSGRARQLAIRTEVIAGDSDFQTAYSFRADELPHLGEDLSERMRRVNANLGMVFDPNGAPVIGGNLGDQRQIHDASLAQTIALKDCLRINDTSTSTEYLDGHMFFVAATPIRRYGTQTIGYLVVALVFDDALLAQLQKTSGAEIALVHDSQLFLSTTPVDQKSVPLNGLGNPGGGGEVVPIEGITTRGVKLHASALPLRAGSTLQGAMVFALSTHDAVALQRRVIASSFGIALVITLLAGLLGFLIAQRIANPIVEIERSFREIAASGDLSRRITQVYSDEVGAMADSFNQMQTQIEQLHARVVTAEQRMRGELKMASTLQEMLFPTTAVDAVRCEFVSYWQPSTEIGGDWLSIVDSPENQISTAIIADVTGHGAPAALVTAILHGFFKATREQIVGVVGPDWQQTMNKQLQALNQTLLESTRGALTTSLFLLSFDHRSLKVRYGNAGHLSALIVRNGQVASLPSPPSSLLGSKQEATFAWGEAQLERGDTFLLYTDGLIECTNVSNEMYGFKRLRRRLSTLGSKDARTVRDLVLDDALQFFGDAPREDDITLIVGTVR